MLSALAYIHNKDHIHRDLKPSNIFFSREEGRLKIGDFGLVTTDVSNDPVGKYNKSDSEIKFAMYINRCINMLLYTALYPEKRSRYQAGTRSYASPEQLRGESCTPKADIYTLGLICFELHYICRTTSERVKVRFTPKPTLRAISCTS